MARFAEAKRLTAIMLLAGLGNASLLCAPAIASRLSSELGYDARQVGLFFSMEFAGYVISGLVGRQLMPRLGWRRIAFFSLLGFLAGTLLTPLFVHSMGMLLAVRVLTASCAALTGVVCMASANESPHASRAYALYIVGQLAIGVLGLAVLPLLFERFGLTSYFVAMGVLLVAALPTAGWLASGKTSSASRAVETRAAGQSRRLQDFPAILRLPVILLFYVSLGGIWTFTGDIARHAGLDAVAAGGVLSAATFAGVIGAMVAAALGKGLEPRKPVLIGYALLLVGGFGLLDPRSFVQFVGAVFAFKFAWTFVLPFVFAIIGTLDRDGSLVAEIYLLAGVGLVIGPWGAGQLVAGGGYSLMVMVEIVLLALSGISVYILRQSLAAHD